MGTMFSPFLSIQASEICAGVAPLAAATSWRSSTMGRFAAMFSALSCGTNRRTSSTFSKAVSLVTLPESSPLAMGENGTTRCRARRSRG